jgi:hypothetical protein
MIYGSVAVGQKNRLPPLTPALDRGSDDHEKGAAGGGSYQLAEDGAKIEAP